MFSFFEGRAVSTGIGVGGPPFFLLSPLFLRISEELHLPTPPSGYQWSFHRTCYLDGGNHRGLLTRFSFLCDFIYFCLREEGTGGISTALSGPSSLWGVLALDKLTAVFEPNLFLKITDPLWDFPRGPPSQAIDV